MAKTIRFADSPLLDAMRDAARDVAECKRAFGFYAVDAIREDLVFVPAGPHRAALRTAFPQ